MVNVADLTITSLDTIKAYSIAGKPRFILDELQEATIANTEEKVDITGKGGRKLNSLKRNKACTISGANGLLSAGMLEAQTGSKFEHNDSATVAWTDYLYASANTVVLDYPAVGTAGAEIETVYVANNVGIASKVYEQGDAVAEGVFTYDPDTRTITFPEGAVEDGQQVVVFYTRTVEADVLVNQSDVYSEKLRLYVDGIAEDKCANQYHVQFYFPMADFNGNFDIALGGDQTVHNFEAESLSGSCGGAGQLWTYTVFGVTNAA